MKNRDIVCFLGTLLGMALPTFALQAGPQFEEYRPRGGRWGPTSPAGATDEDFVRRTIKSSPWARSGWPIPPSPFSATKRTDSSRAVTNRKKRRRQPRSANELLKQFGHRQADTTKQGVELDNSDGFNAADHSLPIIKFRDEPQSKILHATIEPSLWRDEEFQRPWFLDFLKSLWGKLTILAAVALVLFLIGRKSRPA